MKKLFLIILFLFSGCYNYQELNEIAIVSAIGIDKEDDLYNISIQVIDVENKDAKFTLYESKGKSIQEALNNTSKKISKNIYLNSIEIMIINNEIAKADINDILNLFYRKNEVNKLFYVLISEGKSKDILKTITPQEKINSKKIKQTLEMDNKYYGASRIVTFEELLKNYIENKEIVLPSIYIENNTVKLGPLILFNNKFTYLTEEESIFYNLIDNKVKSTYLTIECDKNKYITLQLTNIKNSIKNNNLYIKSNAYIKELNCNYDLNKITNLVNNTIKTKINNKIFNKSYNTIEIDIKILNNSLKEINNG